MVFDAVHVQELERRLGADADGAFSCPLPGHEGRARIDFAVDDPDGREPRLLCCRGRWRSLGEVRAVRAYGTDDGPRKTNREIAMWTRRLGYELGAFVPVDVALPALPHDARPEVVTMRRGFGLLLGVRWADAPPGPVAFSVRFAAAWCELPFGASNLGLRALRELGVIVEVGRDKNSPRTPLYLPGDGAPPPPDVEVVDRLAVAFDATEESRR